MSTLIVGDLHFPYHSKEKLAKLFKVIAPLPIKRVIQIGDLLDCFSWSRFSKSMKINPFQEVSEGRECALDFWDRVNKLFPKADKYQLRGNHDERPRKLLLEKAPELEAIIDFKNLWRFAGVRTIESEREELIIDNVVYMHGYRKHGDHLRHNLASTVVGHSHVGGCVFKTTLHGTLFELNVGHLSDAGALPLSYTSQKINGWTHGFGIIDSLGPRFCPL